MNDLEMCKAIAKLEDVSVELPEYSATVLYITGGSEAYNPITDLALNCALRDKYHVSVSWDDNYIWIDFGREHCGISFDSGSEIPRVSIECILKYKGVYVDEDE